MNSSTPEREPDTMRLGDGYYGWLPRSLHGQLILFTTLSLVVAVLGFGGYTASKQSQMADDSMTAQMAALAKNLADVSANYIVTEDLSAIEDVVTPIASFQNILSILVVDANGNPLSEMLNQEGVINPHYGGERIKLPADAKPFIQNKDGLFFGWNLHLAPHAAAEAWQPVTAGNLLGWVRITYSLDSVHEIIRQIWKDAMLFSGLAIGAALTLLVIMLKTPMQALRSATRFAENLDENLGKHMPVSSATVETKALGSALNSVSTRLQSQEKLLQENAGVTRLILDNVIDGIVTIDKFGMIQSFNQSASTMFGYAANEVIGRNIKMLMTETYFDAFDTYLEHYRAKGTAEIIRSGNEMEGLCKDGSTFPAELAVSHSARLGKPLLIGVVRDITERRRVDKLKSEFVSTVSHELRTPLTSISGALGLVTGGALGEIPGQAKQLLDIAYKNSLRLAHLIDDLLDMDKLIAGKASFDLQAQALMPLLEHTLEAIRAYGDRYQVRFALLERADDAQVRVDGGRLQQAFGNLLSNAAKYSPQGGQVAVAVRQSNGKVRVEVIDHGPGIPDEFRERIFQKFTQADSSDTRSKGGTGLGLAISKEIIEHMDGRLGFDSEEGQGACFYFELPVCAVD
ncbi:MAG: ATP-binding protein [Sterolibacterium sp.]|nr:ATP-binding protein [Sterolibacterium sp.]